MQGSLVNGSTDQIVRLLDPLPNRRPLSSYYDCTRLDIEARPGGSVKRKNIRSKSALELFRDDFHIRLRGMKEKFNPCSKEAWARVREAWAELAPEDKEDY